MPITLNGRTTLDNGERYYELGGERFPSVTTLLGHCVPKPALTKSRMNAVAKAAYDNQETLAGMKSFDKAKRYLIEAAESDNTRRDIGTAVHEYAEASALGKPAPNPTEATGPYLRAYEAFQFDMRPEYNAVELTVYNRTLQYAGTGDIWATINGKRAIIDIKTGREIWPEVALQLWAYANAEFQLVDGVEKPAPFVERGYVLHLYDGGYKLHRADIGEASASAFFAALGMYTWLRDDAKYAIEGRYGEGETD